MIEHNHQIKVYYRDIDKMGIVYYSRFLEYFEEARTELLHSLGLRVKEIEKKGIMLPVITCHCDYKKPGLFEESLSIQSNINQIPKAKLQINYVVKNTEANKIIANGYTSHAFVNIDGKPVRAPKFFLKKLGLHYKNVKPRN